MSLHPAKRTEIPFIQTNGSLSAIDGVSVNVNAKIDSCNSGFAYFKYLLNEFYSFPVTSIASKFQ